MTTCKVRWSWLQAMLQFASDADDEKHTELMGVHFNLSREHSFMSSTNGTVAAWLPLDLGVEIEGADEFTLSAKHIAILPQLESTQWGKPAEIIELNLCPKSDMPRQVHVGIPLCSCNWCFPLMLNDYPDLTSIIPIASAEKAGVVRLNFDLVGRFAMAAKYISPTQTPAISIRIAQENEPTMVRIAGTPFFGLLMPMNAPGEVQYDSPKWLKAAIVKENIGLMMREQCDHCPTTC